MRPALQPRPQLLYVDVVTLDLHPPILESSSAVWHSEADCVDCAARLARSPALANAFIALHGPLGAGKTTFVRHLLRALGVEGRIKSPTFAVLEPYETNGLTISHLDFYRFADDDGAREFIDAGLRDVFAAPGLKLAEWPDRAGAELPLPDLRLELELRHGDQRRVTFIAHTPRGSELLRAALAA